MASDPKHKQEQLRRDRQAIQRQLDVAKASDAKIEAQVASLDAAVRRQESRVGDAVRASSSAAASADAAARKVVAIEARSRSIKQQLVANAVRVYVGAEQAALINASPARSLGEVARRDAYVELFRARGQDLID